MKNIYDLKKFNLLLLAKNGLAVLMLLVAGNIIFQPYREDITTKIFFIRMYLIPFILIILALLLWKTREILDWLRIIRLTIIQIFLIIIAAVLVTSLSLYQRPFNRVEILMLIAILLIVIAIVILNEYKKIQSDQVIIERNLFDPIADPAEDLINRAKFCLSIYSMLKEQKDSNYRYALTGKWGSGKSTCLKFISKFAKDDKYPVIEFSSWHFETKEQAWQGFISAIDRGIAEWKGKKVGPFSSNRIIARLRTAFGVALKVNSIGSLINELFYSKLRIDYYDTKNQVAEILRQELTGKKLFILIDDFDRAPEDVLFLFLLTIRDIIDLPGCIFICAFDKDATYKIMDKKGIQNKEEYLNKIFQETTQIPEHIKWTSESIQHFYYDYRNIKPEIINSFSEILPDNPRLLRNYLNHLDNMHILLKRYDDESLRWKLLYLIELGKICYPKAMEIIEKEKGEDQRDFYDIAGRGVFLDEENFKSYQISMEPKLEFSTVNERDLFWDLIRKIINNGSVFTRDNYESYFNVLNESNKEYLTWKEYHEWRYNDKSDQLNTLSNQSVPIESRREFLKMLLKERDMHISVEADVFSNDDRIESLKKASLLTAEALWFVNQVALHEPGKPVFDSSVVIEWLKQLGKWAHFNSEYYAQIRTQEIDIANLLAINTPHLAKDILKYIPNIGHLSRSKEAFHKTIEHIKTIYEHELSQQLIANLCINGSISSLWGKDENWETKDLFMRKNPSFYNQHNLDMLKKLACESKNRYSLQENFYEMLRMILFYGVDKNNPETRAILECDELRELYWQAATSKPFQRRSLGSLLEKRKKLGEVLLKRRDIMPIPKWAVDAEPDLIKINEICI